MIALCLLMVIAGVLFLLQMYRTAPLVIPDRIPLPAQDDIGYDHIDSEALRRMDNTDTVSHEGSTSVRWGDETYTFFWSFNWGAEQHCVGNGSISVGQDPLKDNFQVQLPHMTAPDDCQKPTKADLFTLLQEAIRIGTENAIKYGSLRFAAEQVVDAIAK